MAATTLLMTVDVDDDGVATVTFDDPGRKVNVLSSAWYSRLEEVVAEVGGRTDVTGLVLRSGRGGQFLAGADLTELAALQDRPADEITSAFDLGRVVLLRLSRLPFPTVAAVEGPCLGGGLEVVLACDDAVCSNHPKTRLGLPEVQLALIPGWGGTQRLPRRIGLEPALRIARTGESLSPDAALAAGLVSAVVVPEMLHQAARERALHLAGTDWQAERERRAGPCAGDVQALRPALDAEDEAARGSQDVEARATGGAAAVAREAVLGGALQPLLGGLNIERELFTERVRHPDAVRRVGAFLNRGKSG